MLESPRREQTLCWISYTRGFQRNANVVPLGLEKSLIVVLTLMLAIDSLLQPEERLSGISLDRTTLQHVSYTTSLPSIILGRLMIISHKRLPHSFGY